MPERSGYFSDASAVRGGKVRDELHFSDFRPALVDVLTTAQTPLTVGVFGPWGSGKTSLLQMLKHDLETDHAAEVKTVWFTAWKYDRHEALWRAFILRVLDALQPSPLGENAPEDERQHHEALSRELDRLEESVYREVEWSELGRLTADWSRLLPEAGKAAGELAAAFLPGGEIVRKILRSMAGGGKEDPDLPAAAGAIRREVRKHYRAQLTTMEQFEQSFLEAKQLALGDRRLVVLVDDLDRCLPEKAIEVLEAIKLFLEVQGTEFVLGMDAGVVERGIEARYGALFRSRPGDSAEPGTRSELPITGSSYLQKMIQIPFHLPALAVEDVEGFIDGLQREAAAGGEVGETTRGVVARGVQPNPRQVKRTLNILRLLSGIARAREKAGSLDRGAITEPLLAKTVLIQLQWPGLYREWRLRPTLLRTLESEYVKRPASGEEIDLGRRAPKAAEGEEDQPEARGLLGKYLSDRHKYALLEQMLAYPSPDVAPEEGPQRARFSQLEDRELPAYTRLAGAVAETKTDAEEAPPKVAPVDLMSEVFSGDTAKIQEAVARLQTQGGDLQKAARSEFVEAMRSPSRTARERAGAGEAVGRLGDPRFDAEHWLLPAEPALGFLEVPAGEFQMGSDEKTDPESYEDERPQHAVTLRGFWIARFPVTAGQFEVFAAETGDTTILKRVQAQVANHPVVNVSWHEANAYTSWLGGKLEERRFQDNPEAETNALWEALGSGRVRAGLPSEAEWEKAARWNGEKSWRYPWADEFDSELANTAETGLETTSAVGCFSGGAGPYGCEEMSGNAWDWTRSLWGKKVETPDFGYRYEPGGDRENLEAPDEVLRVVRGGSFLVSRRGARCACRGRRHPDGRYGSLGFRVVLSPFFSDL